MEDVFEQCKQVSDLLNRGEEAEARNALIILLQELKDDNIGYTPLVNHLIRETGLYPYIDEATSDWQERFLLEAFKVDVGGEQKVTLHREQSNVLKALLNGEDLAISAPTSCGKSFIIDAFIAMKKPDNVVIIVPTIALADETRRRLYHKFSGEYNIITTIGVELAPKNLFVFPQERALNYVDSIEHIDILIVDEFYKAGKIQGRQIKSEDRRIGLLIEAISLLGKKATQRYFLAPNITELKENPFTQGMQFKIVDFNTVYTDIEYTYKSFSGNQDKELKKFDYLERILTTETGKTLIYVNSHKSIHRVNTKILELDFNYPTSILTSFAFWLKESYGEDYMLAKLVQRGVGVHNGRLHRSLSQIQIRLFEKEDGLNCLVSTSSLIEGVNTSARNVVIWSNKNAKAKYDYFTYKNIVGRSGRMFKHFVGKVFVLEEPPKETSPSLELDYPETLLERIDPREYLGELTEEQIAKIKQNEHEMDSLLGLGEYRKLIKELVSQGVAKVILSDIIHRMKRNPSEWRRTMKGVLEKNPNRWKSFLYLIMPILRSVNHFQGGHGKIVRFIQAISRNWYESIPTILNRLSSDSITIENYFELEKIISFDFVSLLHSINVLAKRVLHADADITPFITRASNAFLPPNVFVLEEYGLPRMLSRKIQDSGIINLEGKDTSINQILSNFNSIGKERIMSQLHLSEAEEFILSHFFEGITTTP